MAFICLIRDDIPNGVLQVEDLWPRKSPKSSLFNPVAQGPLYLRQPPTDPTFTATGSSGGASLEFRTDFRGLGAYLIDSVSDSGGAALTDAEATAIADSIIARMRSALSMTGGDILTLITAVSGAPAVVPATLVGDVLRILSGEEYLVPAGSEVQEAGGGIAAAQSGGFVGSGSEAYYDGRFLFETGDFSNSVAQGKLFGMARADFQYAGTAGAAIVIYTNTGALL